MTQLKATSRTIITILCVAGITSFCIANDIGKTIHKKYVQCDSTKINNGAVLIFFTDSTFVNYGILKDLKNQEAHIWYTAGKWKTKEQTMLCTAVPGLFDRAVITNEIKMSYKTRIDHRLVQNYYEFVEESYTPLPFTVNGLNATDPMKQIQYKIESH
jgi:hypothetical protein